MPISLDAAHWRQRLRRATAATLLVAISCIGSPAAANEGVYSVDSWIAIVAHAQRVYPALFPGTPTEQPFGDGRSYRYSSGNTIGFQGDQIYLAGPVVGSSAMTPFQTMDTFCTSTPAACGVTLRRTVTWQNLEREYFVYVPWKVQKSAARVPAVMLVHGSGGHGRVPLNEWGWKSVADREGLLLAAPSALTHCYLEDKNGNGTFELQAEYELLAKWASGPMGQPVRPLCTAAQLDALVQANRITAAERAAADHPLTDDIGGLRQLARILATDWNADAKRLYVSGFSNGGEMAFRMAAEASDLFAAVASAAGVVLQSETTWPVTPRPLSMVYSIGSLNLRGQPVSTTQDVMATNSDLASRTAAFLAILGLSDVHTFANMQIAGFDTGVYVYRTSTRPVPGGNTLYVGVMANLEHEYPTTLPETLWGFFRTQVLP